MLVSKNKATNSLLKSEKKSLLRFLSLYMAMVLAMIGLLSFFYYESQEKLMLYDERARLTKYAYIQTKRLKVLHHFFDEKTHYPRDSRFKSAIYDMEYKKIFSLLQEEDVRFDQEVYMNENYLYFVKHLDDFYLGTKYLILEIPSSTLWKEKAINTIIIYTVLSLLFFLFFGFYLSRIFVRPMRNTLLLLDRFIKETTHELNTPLSAILANIEMMDTAVMSEKNKTKLMRINIATKTVSVLYQDLTYLTLEQEKENVDERLDIKALIENRVEYFMILLHSKQLTIHLDLEESCLMIDRRKWTRVVDNLLSNAIKYNRREGAIIITLRAKSLSIEDKGIGIDKEDIPLIFERYRRFNQSEGGFGVGLNIVQKIVDEYGIAIEVKSHKGEGTIMVLRW